MMNAVKGKKRLLARNQLHEYLNVVSFEGAVRIRLNYRCCQIDQISSEISSPGSYYFCFYEAVWVLIARHV